MLSVTVDDAKIKDMLQRLSQRMSNMTPVMRDIGQELKSDSMANFKGQHAPDGTPWQPLTMATRIGRATRLSSGKGIYTKKGAMRKGAQRIIASANALIDTGVLRASVNVLETTSSSVTVGSRIKYAAIHQFGGITGRGKKVRIPARPFIGMSESAKRNIIDRINAYVGTNQ